MAIIVRVWPNMVRLPSILFLNTILTSSSKAFIAIKVGFFRSLGLSISLSLSSVLGRLFDSLRVPVLELPTLTLCLFLSVL